MINSIFLVLFSVSIQLVEARPISLTKNAQEIYNRAQKGKWFNQANDLSPQIVPTNDGKSFFVVWSPKSGNPKGWIVSIHGSSGFATDDFAIWSKTILKKDLGFIGLQWWIGNNESTSSYYRPEEIYREIDQLLNEKKISPGTVMFHGFSRGSANSYAVSAIDSSRGKKYFLLNVASSGKMNLEYPPNQSIIRGHFGQNPLKGTLWITVAGAQDSNPQRDGIPGMRETAKWLTEQGAVVIQSIEDEKYGHGALQLNSNNAEYVINMFLQELDHKK